LEHVHEFDGYIASLKIQLDDEILDHAPKLKAVFTPSTGLDHIDLNACKKRGIPVFATKNDRDVLDTITATAEMALALLLGVVRRVPWAHEAAMDGIWAREAFRGHQLSGKTMGILGYGRLGTMMADYAKALRMKVVACDVKPIRAEGVEDK
jgi:D-3-phosphoglycerate dehydrogenase